MSAMTRFFFLVLLGAFGCFSYEERDSRIYFGEYADENEFPWIVDLSINGEKENGQFTDTWWQCVGTIIDEEWVLTAGHCLADNATSVNITFGVTNKCSENEHRFSIYINETSRFHYHPEFDPEWLLNDIALIELPYKIELDGTYVDLAYLPDSRGEIYSIGDEAEIAGWGTDDFYDDSYNCWLQKKIVNVVPLEDCINYYSNRIRFNGGTLCISDAACKGDTGGPLNSYTHALQTIYGVISFYHHLECSYGPTGCAWVRYYLDWIKDVSGVTPPNGNCLSNPGDF